MAAVINTNYLSLVAQNNLNKSQSTLGSAIERLSSGLRINSAKDDAAGQAIANRFTANVKGLTQAARNANDGISIAQTTEGALNEINNNLQRVRQLTVQATSGTNSDSDLKSIQDEITQRLGEIDRVSGQTQFNGVKVLAEDNTLKVQVGANDGETISIDLQKVDAKTLGLQGFKVDGARQATAGDLISKFKATGTDNYGSGAGAYTVDISSGAVKDATSKAVYVSAKDGSLVNTATVANTKSTVYTNTATANGSATSLAAMGAGKNAGDKFSFDGFEFTVVSADATGDGDYTAKVDGKTVTFTISDSATTAKVQTSTDLYTSQTGTLTTNATTANRAAKAADLDIAGIAKTGSTLTTGGVQYTVDADGRVLDGAATPNVMFLSKTAGGAPKLITEAVAASEKSTTDPLATLDSALASIDALRSNLGAIQNRFESTVANLNNTITNLSAARSRIEDADYATEVSNMTKGQILQQAGTSVLAQANQVPQTVLSLLR
ncbi:flagellin N-terminal helical domain-containing protein [Achromobacter marplatensis]